MRKEPQYLLLRSGSICELANKCRILVESLPVAVTQGPSEALGTGSAVEKPEFESISALT